MPYVLSPLLQNGSPGMWGEGSGFESRKIFEICEGALPPVNYDSLTIRSHSVTHLEVPAHTDKNGYRLGHYFKERPECFFGKIVVIKLHGNKYLSVGNNIFHWEVTANQIRERMEALGIFNVPEKLIISTPDYPVNSEGFHDPNYVLTLNKEAAEYLVSNPNFNLFGTSWKSSDFNPGSSNRPIHNTLFRRAVIIENLAVRSVPEGEYFIVSVPIAIENASESPVTPILFEKHELL